MNVVNGMVDVFTNTAFVDDERQTGHTYSHTLCNNYVTDRLTDEQSITDPFTKFQRCTKTGLTKTCLFVDLLKLLHRNNIFDDYFNICE